MSVYGLTGNLASGKTTILNLLKNKGAKVFNIDKVVHNLYNDKNSQIYKEIEKLFPEVIDKKGRISRSKLAKIVFDDRSKLKKLESLVHPKVIEELIVWTKENKKNKGIFIAEVPLLFEKKLEKYFAGVILVYVKKDILLKRINKKWQLSLNQINQRLSLFLPIKEKMKRADFIIDNSLSLSPLFKGVDKLWKKLKNNN